VIHVILGAFFSRLGDRLCRLPLGADKEKPTTLGNGFPNRVQCRVKQRHGLRQIHDVNAVARAIDEWPHAGIPTLRLVAKVNASFQ